MSQTAINSQVGAVTTPILRYHGSKFRLAPWIASFFPEHRVYVEPFGGRAGVLLQKPPSNAEVYNDLDGETVNVFRVRRDRQAAAELLRLCQLTPYARAEFELSQQASLDPIEQARRLTGSAVRRGHHRRERRGVMSTYQCTRRTVIAAIRDAAHRSAARADHRAERQRKDSR